MKDRDYEILERLSQDHTTTVAQLSKALNVSQVTIRKDLDQLEKRDIIIREHGGARLKSTENINGRIANHYEAKVAIARQAATLIKDGDILMIESGSSCALLAFELAATRKNLTIITNNAYIASHIRQSHNNEVILLGGIMQPDSLTMTGPMVSLCAENFYVDYCFTGTDGWSENTGFCNKDQMRGQAARDMVRQCDTCVMLAEHQKFEKRGNIPLNLKGKVKLVITDAGLDDAVKERIESTGLQVIRAS